MSLAIRKGFLTLQSVFVQTKRFRGKINIQRPKPPHFERAKYIELAKPYFINPKKGKTTTELCNLGVNLWKDDDVENSYQRIIATELFELLNTSKVVAFLHINPMLAADKFKAFVQFKKENMEFVNFGKKTVEMAVKDTPYEAILDFYVSQNMMVFSPELKLKTILRITKRFRELIFLAGIVEGKFVNKDEFLQYSLIPNLQTAQVGLVQTLENVGGNIVTQLNTHQNNLISNLQERIKQLEEEK